MLSLLRAAVPAILLLLLAACGDKIEKDAPLAFAPADTPYVFANLEPPPDSVIEARFRIAQPMWKPYFTQISQLLDQAAAKIDKDQDEEKRVVAVVRALLDEFKDRDQLGKLKELGFDPHSHGAIYAIGLAPVMRMELGDAAAFRAAVARVEAKSGEKLGVASIAGQDYWRFGPAEAPVFGIMAIQNDKHLVLTIAPKNASQATLRQLLGIDRPSRPLAETDTLTRLGKERGYLPQGIGYIDIARTLDLVTSEHHGVDAEFAAALDLPTTPVDAACRQEIAAIGAKMPRMTFGAMRMETAQDQLAAEIELDAALRQQLATTIVSVPGLGADDAAPFDLAVSLPVLKLKEFWLTQADAVAAAPFKCGSLVKLNQAFAEMKQGLDRTIPPPLSNILGLRLTLDRLALGADGMPDPVASAMRVLVASDNPLLIVSMAQLAAPALKDLKLALDGKSVALPASALPVPAAAFVAANKGALALGTGANAENTLPDYLAANAGDGKTFLRMRISGEFYGIYGKLLAHFANAMPEDQRAIFDTQREMYERYADWLASSEMRGGLGERGLRFTQTTQYKNSK